MVLDNQARVQTFDGMWWPSTKQHSRAPGRLTISDEGSPELELHIFPQNNLLNFFDQKVPLLASALGPPIKVKRLTGWLTNGKVAHLEEVLLTCKGWHNSIYSFNARSKFCIVSNVDFDTDAIEADRIYVKSEGLDEFIFESGFHHEISQPFNPQGDHSIKFKLPQNADLPTENDLQIQVAHSFTESLHESFKAEIKQFTSLKLFTNSPRPVTDWLEDIASIGYFLSLNLGRHLPLQSTEARIDLGGGKEKIDVYFDHGILPNRDRKPHRLDCLVRHEDDKANTGHLLYHFMHLRSEIAIIFGSFFSALSSEPQYIEVRFFMMIRAIEGFHRHVRCNGNTNPKKMQMKQRVKAILEEFNHIAHTSLDSSKLSNMIKKLRDQEVHIEGLGNSTDAQKLVAITRALVAIFAVIFMHEVATRANFNLPEDWVKRCGWVEQRLSGINLSIE